MGVQIVRPVILVVEDVDTCAETLEVALGGTLGLEVLLASTGLEAIRLLQEGKRSIGAVVTDLNMPIMDGYDLIRHIRNDQRYMTLPVLVVSGETDPQASRRALDAGADAYFSKPYSPAQMRQKLEQLLNAKRASEL